MFGANLVILAQIYDKLSCRQDKVYRQTDGRMDRRMQAMTIPLQLKGQGVKTAQNGSLHEGLYRAAYA